MVRLVVKYLYFGRKSGVPVVLPDRTVEQRLARWVLLYNSDLEVFPANFRLS